MGLLRTPCAFLDLDNPQTMEHKYAFLSNKRAKYQLQSLVEVPSSAPLIPRKLSL